MKYTVILKLFLIMMFSSLSVFAQQYVLIGWNDLGMHCSNKNFSKIVVLPPYNNVRAQLIRKIPGQKPQVLTAGYTIAYSIPGNSYSVGKTNFWTYAQQLFNLAQPLAANIGLTGNGLTGVMKIDGNNFIATGIPITPYQDKDLVNENPYQLMHIVARLNNSSTILATTDFVIPVSNEMSCISSGCHSSETQILNEHERVNGFNRNGPVLCAKCHASNALGMAGNREAKSLSFRLHEKHKDLLALNSMATCYKCHPGAKTQCLRDVMRNGKTKQMICQDCHGNMKQVTESIEKGRRPWLDEPKCGTCHGSKFAENTGKLFRESKGHGGLYCSSCHGSPHAIYPTSQPNDNLQNIRLQGFAGTLKKCVVCHTTTPTGAGPHGILASANVTAQNDNESNTIETNNLLNTFELKQNYPNPFNPTTKIIYSIPVESFVTLKVYDLQGKEISTLVSSKEDAGSYEAIFDASNLPSGVYLYRLEAGSYKETKKLILMR
ncbi:MAG: T9SS type A sorting domain-containing protein [Ignavibacteriales bacterium]|nr:T9SS type A sorting domain-containing protein [Ignavibacteriales bacterium]